MAACGTCRTDTGRTCEATHAPRAPGPCMLQLHATHTNACACTCLHAMHTIRISAGWMDPTAMKLTPIGRAACMGAHESRAHEVAQQLAVRKARSRPRAVRAGTPVRALRIVGTRAAELNGACRLVEAHRRPWERHAVRYHIMRCALHTPPSEASHAGTKTRAFRDNSKCVRVCVHAWLDGREPGPWRKGWPARWGGDTT